MLIDARRLDRRVRIEKPVADDAPDGAGSGSWVPVATVWAEVQDVRPGRAERLDEGLNIATRPARVIMRWRSDVTPAMRIVMGDRIMQIIGGPAELGRRDGLELLVEDYSTAGNAA